MSELIVINRPNCALSEEIKNIRANLKFSAVNEAIKVIVMTSSVPGEGKSFVSANLAAAFAQNSEKVLLIDCDLRKGRQHKIFEIASKKTMGFSNLLINNNWEEELNHYIKSTAVTNLSVIPTGLYPPNPSELLSSERCLKIIEKLKEKFDIIILDCPPIIGLNDTLVMSSYADITLLVAKHKSTPMDVLEKSKKALDTVGTKRINVILNQVDVQINSYYYGGYYNES